MRKLLTFLLFAGIALGQTATVTINGVPNQALAGALYSSGSPANHQVGYFSSAYALTGLALPGLANTVLLGATAGDPSWSTISYPTSLTGGHLLYGSSSTAIADLGADLVFNGTHSFTAATSLIFDISAATGTAAFKVPTNTSNTASVAGAIDYDSTASNYHGYNGADGIFGIFNSSPVNGDCVKAVVTAGKVVLTDFGASCGAGSSLLTTANTWSLTQTWHVNTVSSGATPAFDLSLGNVQYVSALATSASPTVTNITAGGRWTFVICNNGTGGYTWTWPASVHGGVVIGTTASKCTEQAFTSPDGTNLYGDMGVVNQ